MNNMIIYESKSFKLFLIYTQDYLKIRQNFNVDSFGGWDVWRILSFPVCGFCVCEGA